MLGSTAGQVVQHAHCPVVIVRRKTAADGQLDTSGTQSRGGGRREG